MSRGYRFGLLGHKIAYSKSPSIFTALAETRKADIRFEVIDVAPDNLESIMDRLKALDGFSVTIPFKETMLAHLDELSNEAQAIGAVNSVRVEKGKMCGYNTDASGYIVPLRRRDFGGGKILVLGTGGAARAVIYALNAEYPDAEFSVCGRTRQRVSEFIADISARFAFEKKPASLTLETIDSGEGYDLIVNCTPVGSLAEPDKCPLPDDFAFTGGPLCYDLVYEPAETVFLARAGKNGCDVIGGLSMLVRQAVESYTIWTGDNFDRDAVSDEIMSRLYRTTKGDNS